MRNAMLQQKTTLTPRATSWRNSQFHAFTERGRARSEAFSLDMSLTHLWHMHFFAEAVEYGVVATYGDRYITSYVVQNVAGRGRRLQESGTFDQRYVFVYTLHTGC